MKMSVKDIADEFKKPKSSFTEKVSVPKIPKTSSNVRKIRKDKFLPKVK